MSVEKRKDWLDYADDKYNENERFELRSALDVIYLFIPLPLFYTLLDQQVSIIDFELLNYKQIS